MGINIDPTGDQKTKIYFNFGRNYWAMPLDAAIRQLGNEQDDTQLLLRSGRRLRRYDHASFPTQLTPSTGCHKSRSGQRRHRPHFGAPSFASSTGEGILPGTKQEYEDEYVIGVDRNLSHSMVFKVRYTDRRLGRIIEDIGSQSPEGSTMLSRSCRRYREPRPEHGYRCERAGGHVYSGAGRKERGDSASGSGLTRGELQGTGYGLHFANDTSRMAPAARSSRTA